MNKLFEKRFYVLIIVFTFFSFTLGFTSSDTDYFFRINKSIEIYGKVFKEITINYVDELDPELFMGSGIEGMLKSLDPYTTYIPSSEVSDVELITTGKYGGIGITISLRDGGIIITSLMEGYSAQRQGLQVGDQIVEVDGKSLLNIKPENVRHLTRGEPGTEVKLKIKREGESKVLEFILIREEIRLKNVTYSDFIDEGIAYIRLERFTRSAGDELRIAIKDLKSKGEIKGLIFDLRNNPGGLLEAAVDVISKFITKGSLIVTTRGRKENSEIKYTSTEEPMLPEELITVLVNQNSASASEIVAGAFQDLDRGVIVGTRTFGKGLVQNVLPLPYNSQLKLTTAKYYTPSGRCIQEIDYIHKGKDGLFKITPDSLRNNFFTKNGRKVQELGGINPDTVVKEVEGSILYRELLRKSIFFKFANQYKLENNVLPDNFDIDDKIFQQFKNFVEKSNFSYESEAEIKLNELYKIAETANLNSDIIKDINNLMDKVSKTKEKLFERNKKEIAKILREEILSRYGGDQGRIKASLIDDEQLEIAVSILKQPFVYNKILNIN